MDCLEVLGDFAAAETYRRKEIQSLTRVKGQHGRQTLEAIDALGVCCSKQGKEKRSICQKACHTEKVSAFGHIQAIIWSFRQIGMCLQCQFWQIAKGIKNTSLWTPDTLCPLYSSHHMNFFRLKVTVCKLFKSAAKYDEAERLYQQALEGFTHTLGGEDPTTLHSLAKLARSVYNQNDRERDALVLVSKRSMHYKVPWHRSHLRAACRLDAASEKLQWPGCPCYVSWYSWYHHLACKGLSNVLNLPLPPRLANRVRALSQCLISLLHFISLKGIDRKWDCQLTCLKWASPAGSLLICSLRRLWQNTSISWALTTLRRNEFKMAEINVLSLLASHSLSTIDKMQYCTTCTLAWWLWRKKPQIFQPTPKPANFLSSLQRSSCWEMLSRSLT